MAFVASNLSERISRTRRASRQAWMDAARREAAFAGGGELLPRPGCSGPALRARTGCPGGRGPGGRPRTGAPSPSNRPQVGVLGAASPETPQSPTVLPASRGGTSAHGRPGPLHRHVQARALPSRPCPLCPHSTLWRGPPQAPTSLAPSQCLGLRRAGLITCLSVSSAIMTLLTDPGERATQLPIRMHSSLKVKVLPISQDHL
ncbi:unnamed protein product [Nyctereutes procyonoides]|uniref:(raccoon dog) hypothetical protein n=1 Tax=Nyctereutes procyonoides TaxID=34880 RepID=A0A811YRG9_NYCPR|nr:unnamed protein product [Nyctereutes procyonoides]